MASPIASTGLKAPQHRTQATVGVSAARDFASRPESVSEVRAFTRDTLANLGLAIDDVVLCVSEPSPTRSGTAPHPTAPFTWTSLSTGTSSASSATTPEAQSPLS